MSKSKADFTFFLGTHQASWLWNKMSSHPLFISTRVLRRYKTLKPATVPWCLDSGGFTELSMFGGWTTSVHQYAAEVARVASECGSLVWASPQDWMCEPQMLKKTGKSVEEHQHLSCVNFCELQNIGINLPIIPVIQGWMPDDYIKHVEMYKSYGISLEKYSTVGVGSVCRRAKFPGIKEMISELCDDGLKLHGFGLKKDGIRLFGDKLVSSDSMAWSFSGRMAGRSGTRLCGNQHRAKNCANCYDWAMLWADQITDELKGSVK